MEFKLLKAYQKAVFSSKLDPTFNSSQIERALSHPMPNTLNLSDCGLNFKNFAPLIKVLRKKQYVIFELDLSQNPYLNERIEHKV
jgi:hypothetical protein